MTARVLFYKPEWSWPRASGHDVHTYHMMRAMNRHGARLALASRRPPPPEALDGLELEFSEVLECVNGETPLAAPLRGLEERFRSYWGVPNSHIARFAELAGRFRADAVVVSGLDVLPMLGAVTSATRIWYAADEWFWHHTSQIRLHDRSTWGNARDALVKGLYERAFRNRIDRAWVVSDRDARALRLVAGVRQIDVLPNGVDADWFRPSPPDEEMPDTVAFWGRLDFGPNVQALTYFCEQVWPIVTARRPSARFSIIGFNPIAAVRALESIPGITLHRDVADLRPLVRTSSVVVFPFVSGGGIKNKFLEAAAMAKPIVCSPLTLSGLKGRPPVLVARKPAEFAEQLVKLWTDANARAIQRAALREWVVRHHDWSTVAGQALDRLAHQPAAHSA